MRKRYTYQDVKTLVENEGYKLISKEHEIVSDKGFVKTSTKITIWCKNKHHAYSKPELSKFIKGTRCKQCSDDRKKLNYQDVKEYIESFGYKLLSKEYINNSTKLNMECPKGHNFKMIYNNFLKGQRCPICAKENHKDSRKLTYEYVKEYIESFGYKLLSKEYINNFTKLLAECPEGHIYEVSYNNFKNGKRCPICLNHIKFTYEYVKNYVESFGYKLLSKEYTNSNEYILVQCSNPNHKPYKVRFSSFKNQGTRCPYCQNEKRGLYNKLTYEYVKEYIESFGYKLLSKEYINCDEKLKIKCDKGHIYEVTFYCFKNLGTRCPICNESKGEIRIREILNKYNIKFEPQKKYENLNGIGDRKLSYDFYLYDYNKLIEYQGEFHDGNNNLQTKEKLLIQQEHDRRKRTYAKDNNIELLEIWYWDFNNIEEILIKELNLI